MAFSVVNDTDARSIQLAVHAGSEVDLPIGAQSIEVWETDPNTGFIAKTIFQIEVSEPSKQALPEHVFEPEWDEETIDQEDADAASNETQTSLTANSTSTEEQTDKTTPIAVDFEIGCNG